MACLFLGLIALCTSGSRLYPLLLVIPAQALSSLFASQKVAIFSLCPEHSQAPTSPSVTGKLSLWAGVTSSCGDGGGRDEIKIRMAPDKPGQSTLVLDASSSRKPPLTCHNPSLSSVSLLRRPAPAFVAFSLC